MIRVLGSGGQTCDRVTRREALRVGSLSLLGGLTLPHHLAAAGPVARAKSVILVNLLGGPAHLDMFDMKPDAPSDIRGEFKPIDTSLPGLQICEHMPRIARTMHLSSLVRTVTHNYDSHNPLNVLTGFAGGDPRALTPSPDDPPSMGAVCQYFGMGRKDAPVHAVLPCYPGWGETIRRPGPYGGFLGPQYDPLFSLCEPKFAREPARPYYDPVRPLGAPRLPGLEALPALTVDRLNRRRSLLEQVDAGITRVGRTAETAGLDAWQQRAFDILTSGRVRHAFDLERETTATRERYGQNLYGASTLTARRLIEAGVVFVTVSWEVFGKNGHAFDTHENNFGMLKGENLPVLDQAYPALIQDLHDRGLLDQTLIIVMGEMGRSPRVNKAAGRDHWPQCGFALFTGGGIRRGAVHGRSDAIGAYPDEDPVSPGDVAATVYGLLGLNPEATVPDRTGRPTGIAHGGAPIRPIIA
jgi:hypothetical protein